MDEGVCLLVDWISKRADIEFRILIGIVKMLARNLEYARHGNDI